MPHLSPNATMNTSSSTGSKPNSTNKKCPSISGDTLDENCIISSHLDQISSPGPNQVRPGVSTPIPIINNQPSTNNATNLSYIPNDQLSLPNSLSSSSSIDSSHHHLHPANNNRGGSTPTQTMLPSSSSSTIKNSEINAHNDYMNSNSTPIPFYYNNTNLSSQGYSNNANQASNLNNMSSTHHRMPTPSSTPSNRPTQLNCSDYNMNNSRLNTNSTVSGAAGLEATTLKIRSALYE